MATGLLNQHFAPRDGLETSRKSQTVHSALCMRMKAGKTHTVIKGDFFSSPQVRLYLSKSHLLLSKGEGVYYRMALFCQY